jgi:acetolactate synthase-1/2/3 large subunit
VAIVGDGDYLMQPGCIWTAAQSKIPLLMIVHNNRAYHQEMMHVQRMADQRSRGIGDCQIGCVFTDPFISYAKLAQGFGVYTEGPVDNAGDFRSAVRRALEVVKKGEPALIDVVSQAR